MPDKPEAASEPEPATEGARSPGPANLMTPEIARNVLSLLRRTTIQWDEMDAAMHARVALEAVALRGETRE